MRLLITGASGAGTTTLGKAVASMKGWGFIDADDYFWLPTNPPFQVERDPALRLEMMRDELVKHESSVVSGSIMNWGTELEDSFGLIVFLYLDASIYDIGPSKGRSLAKHKKWLSERSCKVLNIEGDLTVQKKCDLIIKALPRIDYDSLAGDYARHRRIQPEVLKNLVTAGGLTGASRVLELGCGTGNYASAIEKAAGCSCWGVDPSGQMLAKAGQCIPGDRLKMGRAERLDHPDGFFDLVFSVDVIHHVDDRLACFREARRVLKKGGQVCTVTDSEDIIRRRQPLSVYFPETVELELRRYPRIADLRTMMVEAGLCELRESVVEFPYSLTDIRIFRDKAFSSLHLIPAEAFERGIRRMEQDLNAGPIASVSRYLLLWGTK